MEIRICTAGNAIILSIRPAALSQSVMLLILSLTYNILYQRKEKWNNNSNNICAAITGEYNYQQQESM